MVSLLGIGQFCLHVIFLHELPGAGAGGGLLAEVEPHLLEGRPQLQGLAGHL